MKTPLLISAISYLLFAAGLNAQSGDCPGEIICTTQNDVLSVSLVNEINATNCGCLPPSETAMSYWYEICVSANGTIAFAINPVGAGSDYNIAVWGPSSTCPPSGAPIRCSSALTPPGGNQNADKTGLGQGVLDPIENGSGDGWVSAINASAGECYMLCITKVSGTNDFNMQFDGSAVITCSPLPVELLSLGCAAITDGIEVNWSCATETNNSHFILERTADGITYEFVARIEGTGTTSQTTSYSYVDITAPGGTSFYRLIQVDYNGQQTSYGPIACEFTPAGPSIMEVMNMNGQTVFYGESSDYMQTMNQQNFTEGVYLVILTRGNTRQMFKHAVLGSMLMPD